MKYSDLQEQVHDNEIEYHDEDNQAVGYTDIKTGKVKWFCKNCGDELMSQHQICDRESCHKHFYDD